MNNLTLQNESEFRTERNKYSLIREISASASVNLVPQLNKIETAEGKKIFHSPTSHFIN